MGVEAEQPLIDAIENVDSRGRDGILETLVLIGGDQAIETVVRYCIEEPDEETAMRLVASLRAAPAKTCSALLECMDEKPGDPKLIKIIDLLRILRLPASAEKLTQCLRSENIYVREAAISALTAATGDSPGRLEEIVRGAGIHGDRADDLMADCVAADVERAIDQMIGDDGSTGYYEGQFALLREMGNPAAIVLLRIASDPDYHFRIEPRSGESHYRILRHLAIIALGEVGDHTFLEKLEELSTSEAIETYTPDDAIALAHALHKRGEPKYYNEILRRLVVALEKADEEGAAGERLELLDILSHMYSRIAEYGKAIDVLQAMESIIRSLPMKSDKVLRIEQGVYYNMACAFSMMREKGKALASLRMALDAGYDNVEWLGEDKDLDNIRGEREFQRMIKGYFGEERE